MLGAFAEFERAKIMERMMRGKLHRLRMGQVVGATNARGEEPAVRGMNSNCLLATIYDRFGIDASTSYLTNAGRPIPILTNGQPIAELL